MRSIKILTFLIFISIPFVSSSQTNFLNGYYVSAAHDTVHGLIEYRSQARNHKACVFKSSPDSEPVTLTPREVLSFAIEDKDFYERHSFEEKNGNVITVFFRVLRKGELSLLTYDSRYFARKGTGSLLEITKTKLVLNRRVREDYRGAGNLLVLTSDCPEFTTETMFAAYKGTPDYERIFDNYSACVGDKMVRSEKAHVRPHFSFGVQAGPVLTKLNSSSLLMEADFGMDVSFRAGAWTSIFLPRVNEKLRLRVEANYGYYDHYGYYSNADSRNDLFIRYSHVQVPIVARYHSRDFFLDAGVHMNFPLAQRLRWRVEMVDEDPVYTIYTQEQPIARLSPAPLGYLVGIGWKRAFSRFIASSSLRFSKSGIDEHEYLTSFSALELLIELQFTR